MYSRARRYMVQISAGQLVSIHRCRRPPSPRTDPYRELAEFPRFRPPDGFIGPGRSASHPSPFSLEPHSILPPPASTPLAQAARGVLRAVTRHILYILPSFFGRSASHPPPLGLDIHCCKASVTSSPSLIEVNVSILRLSFPAEK